MGSYFMKVLFNKPEDKLRTAEEIHRTIHYLSVASIKYGMLNQNCISVRNSFITKSLSLFIFMFIYYDLN